MKKLLFLILLLPFFSIFTPIAFASSTLDQKDLNQNGYYDNVERYPAQSFVPTESSPISEIDLSICKKGSPNENVYLTLENDSNGYPSGYPLVTSSVINTSDLQTCPSGEWKSFNFSSTYNFTSGRTYWLVTHTTNQGTDTDNVAYAYDGNNNYPMGTLAQHIAAWTYQSFDLDFKEYYDHSLTPIGPVLDQSVTTGTDNYSYSNSSNSTRKQVAESFTPSYSGRISQISIDSSIYSAEVGSTYITINSDNSGSPSNNILCTSSNIDFNTFPINPNYSYINYSFSCNYNFNSGSKYWIVTHSPILIGNTPYVHSSNTNVYPNNYMFFFDGTSWNKNNYNFNFKEYFDNSATITPTPTTQPIYTVNGIVYQDINQNGLQDSGESGFANATVTLSDGQSSVTNDTGDYVIPNVPDGVYTVSLTLPNGYFATTTNPKSNLSVSSNSVVNFGITKPHNAPTTTASLSPTLMSNGEYPNPVWVTLAATADAGYSVSKNYYQIDTGAQQEYYGPFSVSTAGSHTITYWSVDDAGLEESPHPSKSFSIDSTITDGQVQAGQQSVNLGNGITITGNFTSSGYITVTPSTNNQGGTIPSEYKILNTFYYITSTATFTGPLTISFEYTKQNADNPNLNLLHYDGTNWVNVTNSYDPQTHIMTATVYSLSPFAVVIPDITAPTITDFSLSPYVVSNGSSSTITAGATDDLTGVQTVTYTLTSSTGQVTSGNLDFISPSGKWDANVTPPTGVYSIQLTATDIAGNSSKSDTQYLAVYDPSAGSVTGGGWVIPDNTTRVGVSADAKSNFGFVAKYINGIPTGNMTINYINDGLEFKSTTVDWVIISGSVADFQGQMTLNGTSNYTYRVHVVDSSPDQYDIRIWDGNRSFNNPSYRISNSLGGGSIIIHQ